MGFLKKFIGKNIFSNKEIIKNDIKEKDNHKNIENLSFDSIEENKLLSIRYDREIKLETIYLINNDNIDLVSLTFNSKGIILSKEYLIKFNYGEYIKIMSVNFVRYGMFDSVLSILSGINSEDGLCIGVNTYCKNEIENFYDQYNRLLREKIVDFSLEIKELDELAHNAIDLCGEYTLMDLDAIKFLYYIHSCFYKSVDFGDNETIKDYINMDSVHVIDSVIRNMAEILLEEINEPEIALEHAAFEAFMRAYIEHFAEEFDKYIINECEENEVSDEIGDYRKYIKRAVEIIDFTNEDKLIIALTCKLFSLGLLEEHITLVDAYDIVINEIEIAEKNRNNNLIKDMLRGKKPIDRKKYTIDEVDLMDGYMFEDFICKLFEKMGYSAEVTQKTNDQGIDVIGKKNGRKLGIQAKCYSSKVGNSAIQEAVAGKNFYNCDSVMVITNNYFTEAAKALARANEVILWDRSMLSKKIDEFL